MSNIPIFATPESEEDLQAYMNIFCVSKEIFAAQLAYDKYEYILTGGHGYVLQLLRDNGLTPEDHMIILMTVAGMRWNLLDKENDSDSKLDESSSTSGNT